MEGDDSHGVATAGGAYHELPPVSTFVEEDAGVQGGATDELLIALSGGETALVGQQRQLPWSQHNSVHPNCVALPPVLSGFSV